MFALLHLGVRARVKVAVVGSQHGPQLLRVGQRAVVGNAQAVRVVGVQRLRFGNFGLGARGGVPHVTNPFEKKKEGENGK
jgi:hypothetical protein